MAQEVCRAYTLEDEASETARSTELALEAVGRGPFLGQGNASRCFVKKALRPARKRLLIDEVRETWNVSVRKVCKALKIDRSLYTYTPKRGDQAALKLRIKEICKTRVRFGIRWVHVLLRREGWEINPKRVRRFYNELGLQLRNKTTKREVKAKLRLDRSEPTHTNQIWAMDFVHDQLASGRKLRILTIIDSYSRFSSVTDPRLSSKGENLVETLERVCRGTGYP